MSDDLNDVLKDLYKEEVLFYDKNPRNFRALPDANRQAEGDNPLCGDRFTVFLKLENDVIRDISFQGAGCAISKASASMMTERLKGKTTAEARSFFDEFRKFLVTGEGNEEALGNLYALGGVHKFPMRVKCAILSWHALLAALKGEAAVSTEKP
ncbi:MAG TPA: SUF system NifU family Fe-S cluster assembly protein [Candidatus Acidoferrum sp.]|nr:SUF system NifU family Fe-S cluster assembly protein [Candidatus Acidoferrum sp.]